MRVTRLSPKIRTVLLSSGLLLVGVSTALGLGSTSVAEPIMDTARSQAGGMPAQARAEACGAHG